MNHPYLVTLLTIAAVVACAPSVVQDDTLETDETDDTVEETDTVIDTAEDTANEDTAVEVDPPFSEQRYQASALRILPADRGYDFTGDGVPDNKIAAVLELVTTTFGSTLGSFSVDDVNLRIAEMLDAERAIVLMHAEAVGTTGDLRLDLVRGLRDEDGDLFGVIEDYDESNEPKQSMDGRFTTETTFDVGPAPLTIPIQLYANDPVILVGASEARIFGDIESRKIDAKIAGVFEVEQVMEGIVRPLIEDYFGTGSTADGWNTSIAALLALQADLEVNGQPALSGAFAVEADEAEWSDPVFP